MCFLHRQNRSQCKNMTGGHLRAPAAGEEWPQLTEWERKAKVEQYGAAQRGGGGLWNPYSATYWVFSLFAVRDCQQSQRCSSCTKCNSMSPLEHPTCLADPACISLSWACLSSGLWVLQVSSNHFFSFLLSQTGMTVSLSTLLLFTTHFITLQCF